MARITVEDCLKQIGDQNRFSLIHLAVNRVKQHRAGQPFLVRGKNKETVMTLREIAAGQVSFGNITDLRAPHGEVVSNTEEKAKKEEVQEVL